jgi:hypothetical protein
MVLLAITKYQAPHHQIGKHFLSEVTKNQCKGSRQYIILLSSNNRLIAPFTPHSLIVDMSDMTSCMHKPSRLPSAIVKAHNLDLKVPFFWLLYLSLSKIVPQQLYFDTRHQTWAVVDPRSARTCWRKRAKMTGTEITITAVGVRIVRSIYSV